MDPILGILGVGTNKTNYCKNRESVKYFFLEIWKYEADLMSQKVVFKSTSNPKFSWWKKNLPVRWSGLQDIVFFPFNGHSTSILSKEDEPLVTFCKELVLFQTIVKEETKTQQIFHR